jgi:fluoride exporter
VTGLLVVLGAVAGAPARFVLDRAIQRRHRSRFPWGTLTVNVIGCLILGFLVNRPVNPPTLALLGTGFCGALTTFSTFSYETVRLMRERASAVAVANVAVSVLAGLGAAFIGFALAALGR